MALADVLPMLLETTVAMTAGLLLVLALRGPLRAAFGAGVTYGVWTLVPVATVAVLLPAAAQPVLAVPMLQMLTTTSTAISADAHALIDYGFWLSLVWLLGMLIAVLRFAREQRGFRRSLGRLHAQCDGSLQADAVAGLPVVIGLWRPEVVLPADFDSRYSKQQRALILAHERMHIARGDLHANAIAALLRCVFWFNPLLHFAVRQFRRDQELACDQRVIARHPRARRAYGEAMLKTQLAAQPLPLGCHWLGFDKSCSHPLKERIAMLKQPTPSFSRALAGGAFVAALTLTVGVSAWASQPARPIAAPLIADVVPTASVQTPAPAYPVSALEKHIGGRVDLLIDVDAQGTPVKVIVDHAAPAGVFDQASIDAAMKWKFHPRTENGLAVAGRIRVPITFAPDRAPAAH